MKKILMLAIVASLFCPIHADAGEEKNDGVFTRVKNICTEHKKSVAAGCGAFLLALTSRYIVCNQEGNESWFYGLPDLIHLFVLKCLYSPENYETMIINRRQVREAWNMIATIKQLFKSIKGGGDAQKQKKFIDHISLSVRGIEKPRTYYANLPKVSALVEPN